VRLFLLEKVHIQKTHDKKKEEGKPTVVVVEEEDKEEDKASIGGKGGKERKRAFFCPFGRTTRVHTTHIHSHQKSFAT